MASDINWTNVLITVVVLILLYYLISWLFSSSSKKTGEESASQEQDIDNKDLPDSNAGTNSTYSIWIYIDNWEGDPNPKTIMKRGGFTVVLTPEVNDLQITTPLAGGQDNVCVVPNIPIQKWVCIIISNFGRSQDIYLDGKLVGHLNDATTGGDFTHLRRRDGTTATVGGRNVIRSRRSKGRKKLSA